MELLRENILDVLGAVMEPDLKKDIVTANLVELQKIEEEIGRASCRERV